VNFRATILLVALGLIWTSGHAQSFEPFMISPRVLPDSARFGYSVTNIGDFDGNGFDDYAVGAPGDDYHEVQGEPDKSYGMLRLLMMGSETRVQSIVSHGALGRRFGAIGGTSDGDTLGVNIMPFLDYNNDGNPDLLVTTTTIASPYRNVRLTQFSPDGSIDRTTPFGEFQSIVTLGDLDSNGTVDFVTFRENRPTSGNPQFHKGNINLRLSQPGGQFQNHQLAQTDEFSPSSWFGFQSQAIGDLDGDGISELAVSDDNAFWVLSINSQDGINWSRRIDATDLGLPPGGSFGRTLTSVSSSGTPAHLLVAAPSTSSSSGSLHLLRLSTDGSVESHQEIRREDLPQGPEYALDEHIALSVDSVDDSDGSFTLLMGLPYAHVLGSKVGSFNRVRITSSLNVESIFSINNATLDAERLGGSFSGPSHLIGDMDGNDYPDLLNDNTIYLLDSEGNVIGSRPAWGTDRVFPIGDLNGDGIDDVIVRQDRSDGAPRSVRILFLDENSSISQFVELGDYVGSPSVSHLTFGDLFGDGVARIGDIDGNGIDDFAISARSTNLLTGKVLVFFQRSDGSTEKVEVIDFPEIPGETYTAQGLRLAGIGDVNGDSIPDLAVGLPHFGGASDSQAGEGMVQVLLLDRFASVTNRIVYSDETVDPSIFPISGSLGLLAAPGDINGDGTPDLLVGSSFAFSSSVRGFRVLFLDSNGSLKAYRLVDQFNGPLKDLFESSIVAGKNPQPFWDVDGDGLDEIIIDYIDEATGRRGPMVVSLNAILGADISDIRTTPGISREGENLRVSANVRSLGLDQLSEVRVNFRRSGQSRFLSLPMNPESGDEWAAEIPGFLLSLEGFEYFIRASVPGRADQRHPETGVFSVSVSSAVPIERLVPAGRAEDGYRLVSIPLDLDEADALTIVEASLGEHDASSWRMFEARQNGTEIGPSTIEIKPGSAFWLMSREQALLSWGMGTSLPTDSVFAIHLPNGWSTFGSPFKFDIDPSLLTMRSGEIVDVRRYQGAWTQHTDSTLLPFEGYAIFNATGASDVLYIAPSKEIAELSEFFPAAASKGRAKIDWSIPIHAIKGRARDTDNLAIAGSSGLNRADPPPIGDYVRLAFEGREYPLSSSARNADDASMRWTFNVSSETAGSVDVRFPDLGEVPEGYAVTLQDPATGHRQNLRINANYTVASPGAGIPRALELEVNPNSFADETLPTELKLHPAFPNPFSGATTIQYSLPEATDVKLEIFDMLGRLVATVDSGEKAAGSHIRIWDGRSSHGQNVAPGVYIARFSAARATQTITITKTY